MGQIVLFMSVHICVVVHSLLNVFSLLHLSECSKKAGAGSNRGGEHGTSAKDCQNRQSRAERGFIKWCAVLPEETDLHKQNAHTQMQVINMFANPGLDT